MKECFEVVDATDDERYWPMGIFPTLDVAILATSGAAPDMVPNHSSESSDYDCFKIEIRRREFGFSETGKVVHRITFSRTFDHEGYESNGEKWTRTDKSIDESVKAK